MRRAAGLLAALCVCLAGAAWAQTADVQGLVDRGVAEGRSVITIPPGRYRVSPRERCHLSLAGLRDVTVIATNVELICAELVNALVITNCRNVTVRGLTIDYDPLPFTEGRVTAVTPDSRRLEVELFEGYPDTSAVDLFKCQFFRSDTLWLRTPTGATAFHAEGPRRLRLDWPGDARADAPRVGDILVTSVHYPAYAELLKGPEAYSFWHHAVRQQDSSATHFEDITVYAAHWFAFFEKDCDGTVYSRCRVDRRPPEEDFAVRGFPRLRSGDSDGFHITRAAKGPKLIGCTAQYMEDDGVNIQGFYHLVTGSSSAGLRVLIQDSLDFAAGDSVQALTADGKRLPAARVLSVEPDTPRAVTPDERDFLKRRNMREYFRTSWNPEAFRVRLDAEVPVGATLIADKRTGRGFEISGGLFGHTRARGLLIRAADGRVEGNRVEETLMPAMVFTHEAWWLEGGCPDNALVTGNDIRATMLPGIAAKAVDGLTITGNVFSVARDGAGLEGFVSTQSVSRAIIQGNRWKVEKEAVETRRDAQCKSVEEGNKW